MQIEDGQTILFIGDSITDCGRRGMDAPLGDGYVKLFSDLLHTRHPERSIKVINKGINGDIVTGLRDRWYYDVIANKPDWLSIKIGINDLHTTLGWNPDAVSPRRFHEAYEHILTQTREHLPNCKLLLIDPFYICQKTTGIQIEQEVLNLLPKYLMVVDDMSRKFQTRQVETHAIFQKLLKIHSPAEYCPEPVHPYHSGHEVISNAVYAALE